MANTVRSFSYLNLHDEEFEELMFLLGRLEEPNLVRPKAPDLGLDGVVLGEGDAPAPRGFQSKHFTTGSPSWSQCRKRSTTRSPTTTSGTSPSRSLAI